MPYCPNCLSEYRPGVARCSDCGVELVAGPPPQPGGLSSDTEVVRLCYVADPAEAEVIKAVLAEAGIQSFVREHGPLTGQLTRVADGVTHDYAIVFVTRNRIEDAQRLLGELRSAQFQWPEGMEPDESGDAVESD
jgi:hypothetical protein